MSREQNVPRHDSRAASSPGRGSVTSLTWRGGACIEDFPWYSELIRCKSLRPKLIGGIVRPCTVAREPPHQTATQKQKQKIVESATTVKKT